MADPSNVLALDDLKLMTGYEIRPVVASADDIGTLIAKMNRLDDAVADAMDEDDGGRRRLVNEIRESAADAPVIKLVNSIIAQAVEDGASDIHFEPHDRDMRVRFRVDGVLHETTTIPRRMVAGRRLAREDHGRPRHRRAARAAGRPRVAVGRGPLRRRPRRHAARRRAARASSCASWTRSRRSSALDALGIARRLAQALRGRLPPVLRRRARHRPDRLRQVDHALRRAERRSTRSRRTSSRSRTRSSTRSRASTRSASTSKAGLTFATGLRSILRADPDIIMVGEIRDADTAKIAIEAALTGHLVLSTLHTNDAPSAITRLTEMGIAPFLTASALDVRRRPAPRAPALQLLQAAHGADGRASSRPPTSSRPRSTSRPSSRSAARAAATRATRAASACTR